MTGRPGRPSGETSLSANGFHQSATPVPTHRFWEAELKKPSPGRVPSVKYFTFDNYNMPFGSPDPAVYWGCGKRWPTRARFWLNRRTQV